MREISNDTIGKRSDQNRSDQKWQDKKQRDLLRRERIRKIGEQLSLFEQNDSSINSYLEIK